MAKQLTEAQRRTARSDAGKRILSLCDLCQGDTDRIIGNANLSTVLKFVRWRWINGNGITATGRAALEAHDE